MARGKTQIKSDKKAAWEGIVHLDYAGDPLIANLKDLDDSIVTRLAAHGLEQKLRDSGAGESVSVAYQNATEVLELLKNGQWAEKRGESESSPALLSEAIARIKGISTSDAASKLAGLSREEKALLRKVPAIASAIADIQKERASRHAANPAVQNAASLLDKF